MNSYPHDIYIEPRISLKKKKVFKKSSSILKVEASGVLLAS
jgi:hypothetical protein